MTNSDTQQKASLRAEPRYPSQFEAEGPAPATGSGLIRSTLLAGAGAAAILVLFWLPAEYGIDPTGIGSVTGLTEMGEIKAQLAAEAAADAALAAPALPLAAPQAAADADILARLDRIETQLASIAATLGAAPDEDRASTPSLPTPSESWRDEVSYTLNPGEGIEVKLAMQSGQVARFEWTANGGLVNFDLHGDGGGQKISYEKGRAIPEKKGELVAAFDGNHGWFWRNRGEEPVTVTLRTAGSYTMLRAP